ncbi:MULTISPECIES: hypothetical protein [unclassified Streptomyces]|uniref:hypothetical protein n=1 Tax=unclassified Streptomyces TaxID=2593676 RepID=UPI0036E5674D
MVVEAETFLDEVRSAFADVAARLGLDGPGEGDRDRHLAVATYTGSGVRYRVVLGLWDGDVETHVCRATGATECKVGIGKLALAAGLAEGRVPFGARGLRQLRKSLAAQARYVELVHPLVSGAPEPAVALMRAAGAREWSRPALR